MGREGCSRTGNTAYLVSHLQQQLQREQVLVGWTQQLWPNADGQTAAAHPAGAHVVFDALEQGQQLLEKEEICCRQLVGHPEGRETQRQ